MTVTGLRAKYLLLLPVILIGLTAYPNFSSGEIRRPPRPRKWEPPPENMDHYLWEKAIGFQNEGEWGEAIDIYEELLQKYPESKWAPNSLFQLGVCLEEAGELYAAFQAYQRLLDKYPGKGDLGKIISRQFAIGNEFLRGRKRPFLIFRVRSGLDTAVEIFRAVVQNATFSEFAPEAQYNVGLILQKQGRYEEAELEYDLVLDNYPHSEIASLAVFQRGVCAYRQALQVDYDQEKVDQAVKWFKLFLERFPDRDESKQAYDFLRELEDRQAKKYYRIARYYEKKGAQEGARIYYEEILKSYPNSSWATPAEKKLSQWEKTGEEAKPGYLSNRP